MMDKRAGGEKGREGGTTGDRGVRGNGTREWRRRWWIHGVVVGHMRHARSSIGACALFVAACDTLYIE